MKKITLVVLLSLLSINQSFAIDLGNLKDLAKKIKQEPQQQSNTTAAPQQETTNSNPNSPVADTTQSVPSTTTKETKNVTPQTSNKTSLVSSNEFCDLISANKSVQNYGDSILKLWQMKLDDPALMKKAKQSLNNNENELGKFVADNIKSIAKNDIYVKGQIEKDIMKMTDECAAKHIDDQNFFFFAFNPQEWETSLRQPKTWVAQLSDQYRAKGHGDLGMGGSDNLFNKSDENKISSRWASIAAFAFPNSAEIIERVATKSISELQAMVDQSNEKQKKSIAAGEKEQDDKEYGGMRSVYNLRKNPAISPAYTKCLGSEKNYQSKVTADLEKSVKTANTVAEQKQLTDLIAYRKKNADYIAHGMCIYRTNMGIAAIEAQSEPAALTGAMGFNGGAVDLSAKYTPAALEKIAYWLNVPAESFHKEIIEADFKQQPIYKNAIYETIYGKIVAALVAGKLQQK